MPQQQQQGLWGSVVGIGTGLINWGKGFFGSPDRAERCQKRGYPSNIRNSNHCPDEMPDFDRDIYDDLGWPSYFDVHRAMVQTSRFKWGNYINMYWVGTHNGIPKIERNPLDINSNRDQKYDEVINVHGYRIEDGIAKMTPKGQRERNTNLMDLDVSNGTAKGIGYGTLILIIGALAIFRK